MLADSLHARGVECVAVESSPALPETMKSRFQPEGFLDVIRHELDFEATLAAVGGHDPTHVIAGFESGVELAERLSERLGLAANVRRLREARRDKYLMTEAARARGLRTAAQFRSNDVDEILDWVRNSLDWPVILKPLKSVASDHVFCCRCFDDVRTAAESILSGTNVLGFRNHEVLVQEFLAGTEYAVDTVSYEGQPKTTAFWRYNRPVESEPFVCYDSMTLLPYTGEHQESLTAYCCQLLDALGIQFGPAHCELMWVDGEPVLVESAARLTAGVNAVLSRECGGICQLDETIRAMLAPAEFLATRKRQPSLTRRAANVFLIPRTSGRLTRVRHLDEIRRLPTFHSMSVGAKAGDEVKRVGGLVTLIDESIEAIERDIEVIRNLERDGIFEVGRQTDAESLGNQVAVQT
jgi:biotin carboxylase